MMNEGYVLAAGVLGCSAYVEGVPCEPYLDEDLIDLVARTGVQGADGLALVEIWRANWRGMQSAVVKP